MTAGIAVGGGGRIGDGGMAAGAAAGVVAPARSAMAGMAAGAAAGAVAAARSATVGMAAGARAAPVERRGAEEAGGPSRR